jgi:hypothetical protein
MGMSGEPMTSERYVAAMQQATLLAELLVMNAAEFRDALAHVDHTHALGPILDPTAYRNGMRNLDEAAGLLAPLCAAASKVAPVIEKARARVGGAA